MHITESNLSLASQHRLESEISRQIVQDAAPGASFRALLIEELRPLAANAADAATPTQEENPALALDRVLQSLIRALFGDAASADEGVATPAADQTNSTMARPLRRIDRLELLHTREEESCSFSASGNVCLADGSTRQFDVGYEMQRSEESTRLNYTRLQDPLVVDLAAPAGALGTCSVDFDLDADGQCESMRMPTENSALLFLDRNGNGTADDGSELFGPRSGNGFAELASLDGDGNRWIDEADAAYADLKLWRLDGDGNSHVETLAEAGIGALSTGYADTPFTMKENGNLVGQVRSSGVWLGEHGGAGSVRQIDLAVEKPTA
jgi:hypothetical protein